VLQDKIMAQPQPDAGNSVLHVLRFFILAVLLIGLAGTVTELVLLEHYEEPLQFVPLVLIAAAIIALAAYASRGDPASLLAVQVVMWLFVLAGIVGIVAHFAGSAERQLEINPDMPVAVLVGKVLRAKAPPLLAPGMMIQLGLLGLAYVYTDESRRLRLMRLMRGLGLKTTE
jgi:hypothetical protein